MPLDFGPALEQVKRASLVAAEAGAQVVLDGSNDLVPVESGDLRDTGKVTSEVLARGAEATVSYGDTFPAQAYAVKEHEDLEAHHANGSAKFLERSLSRNRKSVLEAAAAALRVGIGPGVTVRGRRTR